MTDTSADRILAMMRIGVPGALAALLWASPSPAQTTFLFQCVTENSLANCAIGESQLSLELDDPTAGDGKIRITISNAGPENSSVAAVYFDNGVVGGVVAGLSVVPTSGVIFSAGSASPGNLPGGDGLVPAFLTTASLLADADSPPPASGVNPGETLELAVDLQTSSSLLNVLDQLLSGQLRIGLHVISIGSGGESESFVTSWCDPANTRPPTSSSSSTAPHR